MRALAALAVVLLHYRDQLYGVFPMTARADRVLGSGHLGVDLFFALSGFILSYTYADQMGRRVGWRETCHFLWLRIARVWPVHIFTLNMMLAAVLVARHVGLALNNGEVVRYDAWAYVENLVMIHAWFSETPSFNGPAWSISAEWFAYLLFPVVIFGVVRIRTRRAAAGGVIASYVFFALVYGIWFSERLETIPGALVRVGFEFVAGCLLFQVFRFTPRFRRARGWAAANVAVSVACLSVSVLTDGTRWQPIVVPPLLGLLVFCLANSDDLLSAVLSTSVAVFCGEVSYSLYMTHEIVHAVANKVVSPGALSDANALVRLVWLIALSLAAAAAAVATYFLVERPSRSFLRRRWRVAVPAPPPEIEFSS